MYLIMKLIISAFVILSFLNLICGSSIVNKSHISKRKLTTSLSWQSSNCELWQQSSLKQKNILLGGNYLYFFFDKFVFRMKKLEMQKDKLNNEFLNEEDVFLDHDEIKSLEYDKMRKIPDILGLGNIRIFFRILQKGIWYTKGFRNSYLYDIKFNTIDTGNVEMSYWGPIKGGANFSKELTDFTFTQKDYQKWLEIFYREGGRKRLFQIFGYRNFIGEKTDWLDYKVRFAVYYEFEMGYLDFFEGILIEIDDKNFIHVHELLFSVPENRTLTINTEVTIKLKIEDLLHCKSLDNIRPSRLKGIYFSTKSRYFYIFIDDNYFIVKEDLVKSKFLIHDFQKLWSNSKKNHFDDDKTKLESLERLSIKYVKNFGSQAYLTFNREQTHMLIDSHEDISTRKSEKALHKCYRQILDLHGISFCFEEKTYYYASNDSFKSFLGYGTQRRPISDLFKQIPSLQYNETEKIRLIFYYTEGNDKTFFVFLTDDFFYVIDTELLIAEYISPENDYKLKWIEKSFPKEQAYRSSNCLFKLKDCINMTTWYHDKKENLKSSH